MQSLDNPADRLRRDRRDNPRNWKWGYGPYAKIATRPFEDSGLAGTSAPELMGIIVSLAATRGRQILETSAASLAVRLNGGRDTSTVRRNLHRLDAAGYIWVTLGKRRGDLIIYVMSKALPAPYGSKPVGNEKPKNRPLKPKIEDERASVHATNQQKERKEERKEGAREETPAQVQQPEPGIRVAVPEASTAVVAPEQPSQDPPAAPQVNPPVQKAAGRDWLAEAQQRVTWGRQTAPAVALGQDWAAVNIDAAAERVLRKAAAEREATRLRMDEVARASMAKRGRQPPS